jgi:hypothetical protein
MNAFMTGMLGAAILVGGSNDSLFFDQIPHDQKVLMASCRDGDDVHALVIAEGVTSPEFVELSGGRVSRMARLSLVGGAWKVTDASGGAWTYERVHSMAAAMLELPFRPVDSADVRRSLTENASLMQCPKPSSSH